MDKKGSKFRLILNFLRGSKRYFFGGILCCALVTVIDFVNPKITAFMVDSVIGDKAPKVSRFSKNLIEAVGGVDYLRTHLYIVALAILIVAMFGIVCRYFFNLLTSKGAETLVMTMRNDLFRHIEELPYEWHSKNQTGDIIQRCTSDVETIKRFLAEQLVVFVRIILLLVTSLIFMFGISAKLTWAAVAFMPVVITVSILFQRYFAKLFKHADEQEGVLSSIAQENLTGVRVVRAFGREKYEKDRFEKQNHYYFGIWRGINKLLSMYWSFADVISNSEIITVTAYGAYLAVQGEITAGQYIAFISYNGMLTWPLRMIGRLLSQMSKAGVAIDRVNYIMSSEVERDKVDAIEPPLDRDIAFSHVSYSFGESKVLSDVTFNIKAGSTVGILGSTGSGKSTLINLLTRMYDLGEGEGEITIGGVNIKDMKASHLRKNVGIVLQEPYLFSRTLKENIGIGFENPTDDSIREAARMASLLGTIENFKKGFDTEVGERGMTLSGGQKQRTAIAQMIIGNTPVKVFDDSLSAVDSETDAKIRHALKEAAGDSTMILIAHRINTIMNADNIIVMDKGRIIEQGTHEELIRNNKIYKKIYDIQTEGGDYDAE